MGECVLQVIQEMRASQQSRSAPQNPLYWTNRDVADWIRDIQLGVSGSLSLAIRTAVVSPF